MFDLEDELAQLRDRLHDAGIEYALCGGLAVGIHGYPRATIDIDVLIRAEEEARVEEVARQLRADGESLMLDMLLVTPAVADVWQSRQVVQWRGRDLAVVSPDGLIALKTLRGSKQDLADIARLRGEE